MLSAMTSSDTEHYGDLLQNVEARLDDLDQKITQLKILEVAMATIYLNLKLCSGPDER